MRFIYALGFFVSSYMIYKYNRKKNNLLLIHSNSKLARFFKMITDTFLDNYGPSIFLSSGHVQTFLLEIFNMIAKFLKQFFDVFKFRYKKQIFNLSDGGSLIISKAKKTFLEEEILESNKKHSRILIIIPGFTSDAEEFYIKNFVEDFIEEFDCRVINMRGIGKIQLTSPHMISTFCYLDVLEYINNVCAENLNKSVFAVGFSFGGMLLARALGANPNAIPKNFIGGCGICYPVCLQKTSRYGESNLGGIYPRYISKKLKSIFLNNIDVIFDKRFTCNEVILEEKIKLVEEINNLKLISEFDEKFTYKILGFKNFEEYYLDSKLDKFLENIKVPFLSIFTLDDPVIPYDAIPLQLMQKNKNLITMISKKGGHLGFFSGIIPERWINIPIKTFFKSLEIIFETDERNEEISKCILLDQKYFE